MPVKQEARQEKLTPTHDLSHSHRQTVCLRITIKHNTDFTTPVKRDPHIEKTLITAAACNPLVNQKKNNEDQKTWKTN